MLFYFFRQTFKNIRESWTTFVQATALISAAFFIFSSFALLSLQLQSILRTWREHAPIVAYLKENLKEKTAQSLLNQLIHWPEIEKIKLIRSEEAFAKLKSSLGPDEQKLLEGISPSLLPSQLEIFPSPSGKRGDSLKKLKTKLLQFPQISSVDLQSEWFAPIEIAANWIARLLLFGGILVLIASTLIAAGAIRLDLYSHRKEIEIMRLLGATESFIRLPFYLEGVLKGLFASALALSLSFSIFAYLKSYFGIPYRQFTGTELRFFATITIALFLIGGALAGLFGSWLALNSLSTEAEK